MSHSATLLHPLARPDHTHGQTGIQAALPTNPSISRASLTLSLSLPIPHTSSRNATPSPNTSLQTVIGWPVGELLPRHRRSEVSGLGDLGDFF